MRYLANAVSIVFHPFFLPTYALLLLFAINPFLFSDDTGGLQARLIMIVMINTFIFPFIAILIMKQIGFVSSTELDSREERILPYIAACLFYFWCYMSIKSLPINFVASQLMLGATISVFATFFFNLFFKISAHSAAMGNLLALIILVYPLSVYNLNALIFVIIFLGAVVATARYFLNKHTLAQLASGYIVGFISQWIAFTFF